MSIPPCDLGEERERVDLSGSFDYILPALGGYLICGILLLGGVAAVSKDIENFAPASISLLLAATGIGFLIRRSMHGPVRSVVICEQGIKLVRKRTTNAFRWDDVTVESLSYSSLVVVTPLGRKIIYGRDASYRVADLIRANKQRIAEQEGQALEDAFAKYQRVRQERAAKRRQGPFWH